MSEGGLVLTRRLGEFVRIGRDMVVTVAEIRSGQVKLHFRGSDIVSRGEFTEESHIERVERDAKEQRA